MRHEREGGDGWFDTNCVNVMKFSKRYNSDKNQKPLNSVHHNTTTAAVTFELWTKVLVVAVAN